MKTKIQTLMMVIALIAGGDFLSPQFAAASRESARRNAYALSMALEAAGFTVRELYNGALLGREPIDSIRNDARNRVHLQSRRRWLRGCLRCLTFGSTIRAAI